MGTVLQAIHDRIIKQHGWVFIPRYFADIGKNTTVNRALSRLTQQGIIRRLGYGIDDFPKQHKKLGALSPSTDNLAQAIASKTGDTIFPSGAVAANLLGLSTQVPAKPIYLTNGKSRTRKITGRTIILQHARVPIDNQIRYPHTPPKQAFSVY